MHDTDSTVELVKDVAQVMDFGEEMSLADMRKNLAGAKSENQTAAEPEIQKKSRPKKAAKKPDELGKGMTLEQMEARRDGLKDEAKSWTDAISKRKRAERLKKEKAEREKEQRDALEFYRKYRPYIEASKRLKLQSGRTVFEWLEQEIMKGKTGQTS